MEEREVKRRIAFWTLTTIDKVTYNQEKIMQGLTDLQNSIQSLAGTVASVQSFVQGLNQQIATLNAAIAASNNGDPDAQVEAAAQAITAQVATLTGIITPAQTVPIPVVPVTPAV